MKIQKVLLLLILLLVPVLCQSEPITLAWDANPPAENVVAYRVGLCPATSVVGCTTKGETALTQLTVDISVSTTQCLRVLAINQYGLVSDWSTEVCINPTKPSLVNRWRVIFYVPR